MRYLRLLESRRKIEVCWHAITDKKKTTTKNTPLNAVISEVSRDHFLFVLINTYNSKVYNNDNSTNNNEKKVPHDLGVNLIS